MQHYIYVVFSSTPNRMGQLIRSVTKNHCNHVGIAFDPELTRMYSFARRFHRTPLYGGFVQEDSCRYHHNGKHAHIHVSKIPIAQQQAESLVQQFAYMERLQNHYLYNHISALGALFRTPIPARDAYTCVEFCVKILWQLGLPVTPGNYYSVDELDEFLREYRIYEGPMPEPAQPDESFYAKKPVSHASYKTVRDMIRLLPRLGR